MPGHGGSSGTTSARRTTRAPAAAATSTVRSVDPESMTTSSSTSVRHQRDDRGDDRADRRLLVQRGQHDRHASAALRRDELRHRPGRLLPGAAGEPVLGGVVHGRLLASEGGLRGLRPTRATVRAGARVPTIDATMSTVRRVAATSCARNTRAPRRGRERGGGEGALRAGR